MPLEEGRKIMEKVVDGKRGNIWKGFKVYNYIVLWVMGEREEVVNSCCCLLLFFCRTLKALFIYSFDLRHGRVLLNWNTMNLEVKVD